MRIQDVPITRKLALSFLLILLLSITAGAFLFIRVSKVATYRSSKNEVAQVVLLLEQAKGLEQQFLLTGRKDPDFLTDGESPLLDQHKAVVDSLQRAIHAMQSDLIMGELGLTGYLSEISTAVNNYQQSYQELIAAYFKRGFKDWGLEGEMRDYVHELQKCVSPEEKVYAFSLRRHEKDFMLRLDAEYAKEVHETAEAFKEFVQQSDMPHMTPAYKAKTIKDIDAYVAHFDRLADMEIVIGLTNDKGIKGKINQSIQEVEPLMKEVYGVINAKTSHLYRMTYWFVGGGILLLLVLAIFAIRLLSRSIARPIIRLDQATREWMKDKSHAMMDQLDLTRRDEFGNLNSSFTTLIRNMEEQLQLVHQKNEALEQSAKEDQKRKWHIEGITLLNDIIKSANQSLQEMTDAWLAQLIKFAKLNQGGIYMYEEDAERLSLESLFAYDRKKYQQQKIKPGEGLVGQVFLEKEAWYFTDIPEQYVHITSGLGAALPRNLLVVPLLLEGECLGVLELAGFEDLAEYQRVFIQEAANRLASQLHTVQVQQRTNQLLAESQELTEQLQSSEEEIRQNMEEMQATQEEVQRQLEEKDEELQKNDAERSILQGIISKVYEGVLVANEQLEIAFFNEFIIEKLGFEPEELKGAHVEQLLRMNAAKWVKEFSESPSYLVTGFSSRREIHLMDKFGNIRGAAVVTTLFKTEGTLYYVFLFTTKDDKNITEKLRKLAALKGK